MSSLVFRMFSVVFCDVVCVSLLICFMKFKCESGVVCLSCALSCVARMLLYGVNMIVYGLRACLLCLSDDGFPAILVRFSYDLFYGCSHVVFWVRCASLAFLL